MKKTDEELIEITDKAIAELVYSKTSLQKAYNYYHGKMDAEQYRYLEENYGIGNPTSVEFIPLIKKHVDALIGEYLDTPIIPKISCKDKETITAIERDKQIAITKAVYEFLEKRLNNAMLSFLNGQDVNDSTIQKELDKLVEDLNNNFTSEYEVAAQNVIEYIMQSRTTDIYTKLRHLLLDLLITGYTFYRVKPSASKTNIEIEVLSPLNTFIDRNPNSPYVKDSYRSVVRKWLTKHQILNEYGKDLSAEDRKTIEDDWQEKYVSSTTTFLRGHGSVGARPTELNQDEAIIGYPSMENPTYNYNLIPVYEVEWLETDKDFKMQRYKTVRIGQDIFVLTGLDDTVVRSKDNPDYASLTLNGVYFLNRSSQPYSLVLACGPLQEKYNLLHFYRDSLIANSGSVGDYIDMSLLPQWLGTTPEERLLKYIAYKKAGMALLDTAQEGRMESGAGGYNQIFNGFDDTVKAPTIQAIQMAIDSIEQTTSSITGVFRERLNGIQQRDAVTNVKQGVSNSFTITKPYYQQMDLVTREILIDSLNEAKIVWKKGLTGTLILGDKQQRVFTALPEYYTVTDHDIHVITATTIMEDMQQLKQIIPEFIKSGQFTPEIIFEALTAKSLTDLKQKVRLAMAKQREENNQLTQALQQNEELQKQVQQMQSELQKAQNQIQQLDQQRIQLEQAKFRAESEIEWYKAYTDRTYKEASAETEKEKVEVEKLQLTDGNPYNDKMNFSK